MPLLPFCFGAAHPKGFERQLDAIAALCPAHVSEDQWDMMVSEQLRARSRTGYQWEELISSWTAMYGLLVEEHLLTDDVDAVMAAEVPAMDEFMLEMYSLEDDPAAQLDTLASYKPAYMYMQDWDREVGKVRASRV